MNVAVIALQLILQLKQERACRSDATRLFQIMAQLMIQG